MKHYLLTLTIVGVLVCAAGANTWTGDGADDYYATGTNWQEGSAPGFGGTATFTGTPTPSTDEMDMNGFARTNIGVEFLTAGWSIIDSAGTGGLRIDNDRFLTSAGAGVNQISASITTSGSGSVVTVSAAEGNTLQISGSFVIGSTADFGGTGTIVFDTTEKTGVINRPWTVDTDLTMLFNTTMSCNMTASAGTIGGTGTIQGYQYQTSTLSGTAVLSPGGNGTLGNEIGTLTWTVNNQSYRHELVLDSGASVEIQIGSTLGDNDKLVWNVLSGGGNVTINSGVTLNLYGDGALEDGDYTIIENADSSMTDIAGTFTDVYYNDSAIDPENFTVNYLGDSITVSISGIVPEPATMGLLGLGALALLRKKRK